MQTHTPPLPSPGIGSTEQDHTQGDSSVTTPPITTRPHSFNKNHNDHPIHETSCSPGHLSITRSVIDLLHARGSPQPQISPRVQHSDPSFNCLIWQGGSPANEDKHRHQRGVDASSPEVPRLSSPDSNCVRTTAQAVRRPSSRDSTCVRTSVQVIESALDADASKCACNLTPQRKNIACPSEAAHNLIALTLLHSYGLRPSPDRAPLSVDRVCCDTVGADAPLMSPTMCTYTAQNEAVKMSSDWPSMAVPNAALSKQTAWLSEVQVCSNKESVQ